MEIKPGKFVVLTYDLYAGAGEPEETLMMRATDECPTNSCSEWIKIFFLPC